MNIDEYKAEFAEPDQDGASPKNADTRAGRALEHALDIRKFEIELYWKRATYFWAFIAAAFAAYALTYKSGVDHEPWLSVVFSALGLVFSFAWYLVNRGSKFWQENWERHVDLLEEMTLGPLYEIIATTTSQNSPLTGSGQFSVTKINQMLSIFVTVMWGVLFFRALLPWSFALPIDWFKVVVALLTTLALVLLYCCGKTDLNKIGKSKLHRRSYEIET